EAGVREGVLGEERERKFHLRSLDLWRDRARIDAGYPGARPLERLTVARLPAPEFLLIEPDGRGNQRGFLPGRTGLSGLPPCIGVQAIGEIGIRLGQRDV